MIKLGGISKYFQLGDQIVKALDNIDIEIPQGEYVSIMGPSGSGKSTLLNLIALLDSPTHGEYLLNGQDVTRLADEELAQIRRENFGFVFQFFHLITRLTARENIEIPLILSSMPVREREQRVGHAIEAYGLSDRVDHRPEQLSGGERQRVAIARATIMQPRVLLADEPTGNLDQATGKQVVQLLEQLNQDGMTLITVTHDPNLGKRASRRIRLVDGRITEDEHLQAT